MNALILGGSRFVGRHIVEHLLAAGYRVTILNRGQSPDELSPAVERLRGDRDAGATGLDALRGRTWDACIDVSGYTPKQVRPVAQMLNGHVGRYVFISAVSVYGDPIERPVRETHLRVPPTGDDVPELNSETYRRAKVACEDIVEGVFGARCTILRPQIVVGAHDPYDRYSYWVRRAGQGGAMLAPGDGDDHVQVIDALDLACFARIVLERNSAGSFNLAGPRLKWREFLRITGATNLVWVAGDVIKAADILESELPLYRMERGPRSGLMDVSNDRAIAAGLTLTDPALTVQRVRAWLPFCRLHPALSREREAELLQRAQHDGR